MDYVASAVMEKEVKSVGPAMTLAELEDELVKQGVSGFAVVDNAKFVGVVSRSDVVRAISPAGDISRIWAADEREGDAVAGELAKALGDRAHSVHVADIMTENPITVSPNDHLHVVADLMYQKRIHRVFVVEDGLLVGVITTFDFVRLYSTDCIGMEGRPNRTRDF